MSVRVNFVQIPINVDVALHSGFLSMKEAEV